MARFMLCIAAVSAVVVSALAASSYGYGPKCYKEGEKCIGAPGYPAVPYLGCCDGYVCEGKAYDWGFVCVKPKSKYEPKEEPEYKPKEEPEYKPKEEPEYKPKEEPKYEPTYAPPKTYAPATTYAPRTTTTTKKTKKCLAMGAKCGDYGYAPCCRGLSCVEQYGGKKCMRAYA